MQKTARTINPLTQSVLYPLLVLLVVLELTFCFMPSPLYGEVPQTNIRETCRKRVSGLYLSTFDTNERAKQLLKLSKEREKTLNDALVKARAKFTKLKKLENRTKFDISISQQMDQAETTVNHLNSTLKDQRNLKASAEKEYNASHKTLIRMTRQIEKVFIVSKTNNLVDYQSVISYKDKCPKYRHVCPLPRKSREQLLKIFEGSTTPESCQKYSGHFR